MWESSSDNSTPANYQLYELITQGASPVTVSEMKIYLGLPASSTAFDTLLDELIDACTSWGEAYTSRDFRDNQYELYLDCFEQRLSVRRNPIDTIDSVKYSVATNYDTTVTSSVYYLKNGVQLSEILLLPDQDWPTDGLDIEQGIQITFTTKAVNISMLDQAIVAIKRHVAFMFSNRGDCGDCGSCAGGDAANVEVLYNLFRIARV